MVLHSVTTDEQPDVVMANGIGAARARTVTMQDIARASGVSQSTVSRVLNDTITSVPIAAATRQRVLEVASRLGYRPNPLARGLRGAKTMLLGVIVREISDLFFTVAVEAISTAARRRNYNVVLGTAHSQADEAIALRAVLETRHCDGIAVLGDMRDQPRLLDDLQAANVPAVVLWQGTELAGVATINVDNRAGIASAIDHLVALGHRRFGFIGGDPLGDIREREAGFNEHLAALGLTIDRDLICPASNTPSSGAAAFRRLIEHRERPTAIVTATDQVAIGALHAAHALGVNIPGQVSIVGFDDIPISEYTAPPLTTVHQPIEEMAELAVQFVVDDPSSGIHRVFDTTLAIRHTTGPPPS